jgi:ATP adenylyltransferase
MDHLHAYWRMEYIKAPKPPDGRNPFSVITKLGDDAAALIVHRSEFSYLVLNLFPYNAGHLLAVPFREVPDLELLEPAERVDLFEEIVLGKRLLTAALKPNGFNIGFNFGSAAGAGIPQHLHAHIVPRWSGDTNFMPVIGQTRVLPEALSAMHKRLVDALPAVLAPATSGADSQA